ncbi:MAG: TolC family protein [Bacteroidales bacterium]|nr:TolC family protein [Bacteroidales bacterium]MCF8327477.1 TolC family protein [Bacteroidales bacterium]
MSMIKKHSILVLVSLFLSTSLFAQQEENIWTLDRCLNYAEENNLNVKLQKLNVDRSKAMLKQQKAGMAPDLSAYAQHDYNWGRTVDRFTNDFANTRILSQNFYISSGVTLFNGFRMLNRLKERQLALEATRMHVEKTVNDIRLSVVTAYLQVLFNKELVEVNKNQLALTQQQVEQTEKQVKAGALAKGALLKVKSQLAQEKLNLVNAQNQRDLAVLELKQTLELPEDVPFQVPTPEVDLPENIQINKSPRQVYEYAKDNQPAIQGARLNVKSKEKALSAARGAAYPNLQVQASYGTGYSGASKELTDLSVTGFSPNGNITQAGDTVLSPDVVYDNRVIPFKDQIDNNSNYSLGLSLSVPIFNGLQRRTQIQTSKIEVEQAKIQLKQEQNAVRKTIEQAHADAKAALNRYYAAQQSKEASLLAFQDARQKFDVGMINAYEYNDAKNKLSQAESDLLQAKFEYLFRKKVLDFYLDKPLIFDE